MAQRRSDDRFSEYDWASEHVADPAPPPDVAAMLAEEEEEEEVRQAQQARQVRQATPDAGDMVAASFRLIAERTGGNPFLLLAILGRVGGMTLKEIGALSGCTKQAVDKHLREIAKRDPAMANVLRQRWQYQAALDPAGAMLARLDLIPRFKPTAARKLPCPHGQPMLPGLRVTG
jgi:hypothetical protein